IDRWDPTAFVTIEEPRAIRHGWLQERPRERLAIPFVGPRAKTVARAGEASADSPPEDPAPTDTAPEAAEATERAPAGRSRWTRLRASRRIGKHDRPALSSSGRPDL